jgi:hypothetical protein
MDEALSQLIWEHAGHWCEYCQLHQDDSRSTFEVDHVIARKHGGKTVSIVPPWNEIRVEEVA